MEETTATPVDVPAEHGLPSCDGCRVRKLKCSRDQPSCTKCRSLGVSCIYDMRKSKPGLKAGAVETLSKRIDALERMLCGREQTRDGIATQVSDALSPLHGSLSTMAHAMEILNGNISVLAQSITLSGVSPLNNPPQDAPTTDGPRPTKRLRLSADNTQQDTTPTGGGTKRDSADYSASDLLSGERLDALLDAYFMKLHPWIPMIHQSTFRQRINHRIGSEETPIILDAILVGALHLVDTDKLPLPAHQIRHTVENARKRVIIEAMSCLSVENLQALTIIAFTEIGSGEPLRAWPIIASLTRTVEYLHLNVEDQQSEKASASYLSPLPLPPPKTWLEEEERRRVFWNIFVLDRSICAITTGWTVGLTADNVSRRLPMCGTHWNDDEVQAQSPFFEIWDRSAASISNSVAFLPAHCQSPGRQSETSSLDMLSSTAGGTQRALQQPGAKKDTSAVGAFAYFVESVESLCRVVKYFLQQKVNFNDPGEVSSWLTRFKELDLHLVHWKMFLPPKWKDPTVPPPETASFLDPNMSLAHVTHNTSMIMLHQRIGYPGNALKKLKLPNFYSAETCQSAAVETANITREYLASALPTMSVSPRFAFCAFVSAKVLLVHARYYGGDLDPRFQILLDCLRQISRRWQGNRGPCSTIAETFETELMRLWTRYREDPTFRIDVLGPLENVHAKTSCHGDAGGISLGSRNPATPNCVTNGYNANQEQRTASTANTPSSSQPGHSPYSHRVPIGPPSLSSMAVNGSQVHAQSFDKDMSHWLPHTNGSGGSMAAGPGNGIDTHDELSSILEALGDSSFMEMDRIISFEENYSSISSHMVGAAQPDGQAWTSPVRMNGL